jgi:hypothetical protein
VESLWNGGCGLDLDFLFVNIDSHYCMLCKEELSYIGYHLISKIDSTVVIGFKMNPAAVQRAHL